MSIKNSGKCDENWRGERLNRHKIQKFSIIGVKGFY